MSKYHFFIILSWFVLNENNSAQDTINQNFNYRNDPSNYLYINSQRNGSGVFPLGYRTNHLYKSTTGTGIWTELNPLVPRVDYLGIHFIDPDTGWAVGAEGAIIYSVNGGVDWFTANSPTSNVLLNVHSFNGRVIVASGYNGTIVRSTDGGINWQIINSGVVGNLWEIKMTNDTLGWVCGTGPSLLRTTNGGESWNLVNTGFSGFNYWAFDYLNENILYIAGSGGNILKTTNGGVSWQLIQTGSVESLYRIVVFDTLRIVTGGQNAKVFYTFNGGATWNYSLTTLEIDAMAFANDSVGYLAGYSSGSFIYKTTNGGVSWQPQTAYPGAYWLMFVNDSIGFNVGLDLVIKKTTNQGNSWNQLIFNDNLKGVCFESENLGWVLSGGKVSITTDGGSTWSSVIFPGYLTITGLSTIYFLDSLVGFVGAGRNRIFKTMDGGYTWQRKNVFGTQDSSLWTSDFFFIDNNTGWASNLNGDILRTTDVGENWFVQLQQLSIDGFTSIFFVDSSNGWSTGRYIWQTTDGGINWIKRMDIPIISSDDIYFQNLNTGWIGNYSSINNSLFKTTDGGLSWIGITEVVGARKFYLFPDPVHWLTLGFSRYYWTNDYGNSWQEFTSDVPSGLVGFSAPTDKLGFAVGSLGLILRYDDTTYVSVELTSFEGGFENDKIILSWITSSELNNYGFYIEKSVDKINWKTIGFVEGKGSSTETNSYNFVDHQLTNVLLFYRLKQTDYNGNYEYSEIIEIKINSLVQFNLLQNFPNPFNPYTNIVFTANDNKQLQLKVFNVLGEEVIELFNEIAEPGKKYNLVFDGSNLPSGVYYYSLIQGDNRINKKMILLK